MVEISENIYGTRERQQELLKMMKEIDMFLMNKKIVYSLCGGSLLGAVRHHGFIPWDDDIDIMLDRTNYYKLLSSFKNVKKYKIERHLWIYRIQRRDDQRAPLKRATIDIFVMDNCPDSDLTRKMKRLMIAFLQGMMKEKLDTNGFSRSNKLALTISYFAGKPFSSEFKFRLYEKVSQIGNKKKTKYMTGYNDLYKLLKVRYSGDLMNSVHRTKFEDTSFPITDEYDSYLTAQYGDYMTPPKEEERKPEHLAL